MTIIQAFNVLSKHAHLLDEHDVFCMNETAPEAITMLTEQYGLTAIQSVILSRLFNAYSFALSLHDLASSLSLSNLTMLCYEEDLKDLCHKQFITLRMMNDEFSQEEKYCINSDFVQAVRSDEAFVVTPRSEYHINRLLQALHHLASNTPLSSPKSIATFCGELRNLIADTRHLQLSRRVHAAQLSNDDLRFLLAAVDAVYTSELNHFNYDECSKFFANKMDFRSYLRSSRSANTLVERLKWFQCHTVNGTAVTDDFSLSRKFFEEVLPEYDYLYSNRIMTFDEKRLEDTSKIAVKQLFYNPRETAELQRLTALLQHESFLKIQQRLQEMGMRNGFACLFYGAAGCGKTETVLQLARATGRKLMRVNPNDIRDKYVGESEKNLKSIFDRYHRLVKQSNESNQPCPILLFNEADAIFSRRLENIEDSTHQMQNALQNILLQEMETLPGILIATTNLSQNFDSAFERRFIFKVYFEKPTPEVASHIWQSMLPMLTENEALQLAREYSFSGGQIENVVRKQQVEYILTGNHTTMADLHTFCKQETLISASSITRKRIGFCG